MAEEKKDVPATKSRRPQALKRDIQSKKKYIRNKSFKSKVSTTQRALEQVLAKGDASTVKAKLSEMYSLMDKGLKTGLFKQNKVNRVKSRLQKRIAGKARLNANP